MGTPADDPSRSTKRHRRVCVLGRCFETAASCRHVRHTFRGHSLYLPEHDNGRFRQSNSSAGHSGVEYHIRQTNGSVRFILQSHARSTARSGLERYFRMDGLAERLVPVQAPSNGRDYCRHNSCGKHLSTPPQGFPKHFNADTNTGV